MTCCNIRVHSVCVCMCVTVHHHYKICFWSHLLQQEPLQKLYFARCLYFCGKNLLQPCKIQSRVSSWHQNKPSWRMGAVRWPLWTPGHIHVKSCFTVSHCINYSPPLLDHLAMGSLQPPCQNRVFSEMEHMTWEKSIWMHSWNFTVV